jgi:hypothetical protein
MALVLEPDFFAFGMSARDVPSFQLRQPSLAIAGSQAHPL